MKINKRLRKAFTLVELVVVIAIIAILSTVSVVTYFGITNSAKKSVDDTLIAELNKCLQLDETINGKPNTPSEALEVVEENGFTVEKMTPTQDKKEIVWHQTTNKFELVDEITENGEVIFDQTTFYAESGGQVADTGVITSDSAEANVLDVTKANHKQFLHHVELAYGSIKVGDEFTLKPDYARRHLIMRNHSATHILQKALQELLGDAVHQEGSYVNDNELRFDFSYDGKLSFEELRIVERRVNEIILKGIPEKTNIMNKEEALKLGAMALFNEKYDDVVRVVTFGDYSKEFCGGTHVSNTADILNFAIASYETIAAGVKRIVAYTG